MRYVMSAALAAAMMLAGCARQEAANSEQAESSAQEEAPLVKAIAEGDQDAINTLLSAGVPLDATQGEQKVSALMMAVNMQDAALVQRLLDAGAPIDQRDQRGDPAINYATYYGNAQLVRLLKKAGARLDLVGHGDAHDIALRFGREEVTQTIAPDADLPPLLAAAKQGNASAMRAALAGGADIAMHDASKRNALHLAAKAGSREAAITALEAGIGVDSGNKVDFTPLIIAARDGHEDVVQLLLDRGADVNHAADKRALKMRALFMAAINGHTAIVDQLLAAGADINARDTDGGNAFTWALGEGQSEMAIYLLGKGSDLGDVLPPDRLLAYVERLDNEALTAAVRAKVKK